MKPYGNFDVYILQSTVYVEPQDEEADVEGAWEACKSIFGVNSICRCRPCEKNMDAIFEAVEAYLGDELDCAPSFKVESKRSDKQFPMSSIAISQEIGGRLAEAHPGVAVDVHHPAYTVYVEVRDLSRLCPRTCSARRRRPAHRCGRTGHVPALRRHRLPCLRLYDGQAGRGD